MGQKSHPLPILDWKRVEARDGTDLGRYAVRRGLLVIRTVTDEEFIRDAGRDEITNRRIAAWILSGGDVLRAYPRKNLTPRDCDQTETAATMNPPQII
jgi:hypothetical protein